MFQFLRSQSKVQPVEATEAPTEKKDFSLSDPAALALFVGGWDTVGSFVIGEESAMRVPAVSAAVRLLTESAMTSTKLYRRGDDDAREEASDHAASILISGWASDWQTAKEFRRDMTHRALFEGRSYALVERVNGNPTALYQLPFSAVRREVDKTTAEPSYYLRLSGGGEEVREWTEILEFSPFGGRSLVRDARDAIALAQNVTTHTSATFRNRSKPGGLLKVAGKLGPEAINRLRASFQAAFGGGNAGGVAILEDSHSFEALKVSLVDDQTEELSRLSVEEIARAMRVPAPLINDLSRAVWKNVEQLALVFATYTMKPMMDAWAAAYSRTLIEPDERASLYVESSLNELVKADLSTRMTSYRTAIESGVLTRNEARARENLPGYEGGDVPLSPLHSRQGEGETEMDHNDDA